MMRSDGNERASLKTRSSLTSRRMDALNGSTDSNQPTMTMLKSKMFHESSK